MKALLIFMLFWLAGCGTAGKLAVGAVSSVVGGGDPGVGVNANAQIAREATQSIGSTQKQSSESRADTTVRDNSGTVTTETTTETSTQRTTATTVEQLDQSNTSGAPWLVVVLLCCMVALFAILPSWEELTRSRKED